MYDRGTQTLWHQFLGEPVVGPLANSGIKLNLLPVVVTTWGEWRSAHPDTTLLDINTGIYTTNDYPTEQHPRSVYYGHRQDSGTMFPVWQRSSLLRTKEQVLGLNLDGKPKAYPLDRLRQLPVVNDTLGNENLVVVTTSEAGAARAYERDIHLFSLAQPREAGAGVIILVDEEGRRWRMEEEALVQVDDPTKRLKRLPSRMAYWFGWYAFYPATDVYGEIDPIR